MENLRKFYIDGKWVTPHSAQSFAVTNPATEEIIDTMILGDRKDVDRAVEAALRAFYSFSQTTKTDRLDLLQALLVESRRRMDDMVQAMTLEMGVPVTFSREMQADAAIGHLEGFIEAHKAQELREDLGNGDVIVREPIGVCGLITPWNWPINQVALKVIPAIATGCSCILKPSEYTPLSAVVYAEIIDAAGIPAGVFNLVQGDGPTVGAGLAAHPDVHMMSFTGSSRAGKAVMKASADTIKRVTLELGGKSPDLVFADCDVPVRVRDTVLNCFSNTGQSCDAPTRMLVERSVYDQAVAIARDTALSQRVDDPNKEGDHLGPLFDQIQYDRVQRLIQIGLDEGAKLVAGGLGRPDGFDRGWYVKPTVFADVNNTMEIAQEEIFGPVIVLMPFDSEEEAIEIANDTPYGLAAYIECGDPARAERIAARLRVGAVHINGAGYQYGSPFGGYRQSGNGREGGMMGLEDYQEVKTLHIA
ncbi:MAG: aldehyde dehydrogenase family protein [Pseudomonadota bacterium]